MTKTINLMPFAKLFKNGKEEIIAFPVPAVTGVAFQWIWNNAGAIQTGLDNVSGMNSRDEVYNWLQKQNFYQIKNRILGNSALPAKPTGSKRIS